MSVPVSVIMAVFNADHGESLMRTIESVLRQSYDDFEFIIIDDGSTDSTVEVLRSVVESDPRLCILRNDTNQGLTKSLNRGLDHARGQRVARIDAGDVWRVEKLAKQMAIASEDSQVVLIGSWAKVIDNAGRVVGTMPKPVTDVEIRRKLIRGSNPFVHSAVLFKAGIRYDERFVYAQDFELWTRLSFLGRMVNIPEALTLYQRTGIGISVERRLEQAAYARIAYESFAKRVLRLVPQTVANSVENDMALCKTRQRAIHSNAVSRALAKLATSRVLQRFRGIPTLVTLAAEAVSPGLLHLRLVTALWRWKLLRIERQVVDAFVAAQRPLS